MTMDFAGIFAWPFEVIVGLLAVLFCYMATSKLLLLEKDDGERALALTLGIAGMAYTYRQVRSIGWVGIVIALLAGILIYLLGEVITEEETDEV